MCVCTHKHTPRPESLLLEESYLQLVVQQSSKGSLLQPQSSHRACLSCTHTFWQSKQSKHAELRPSLGDLVPKLPGASLRARVGSGLCCSALGWGMAVSCSFVQRDPFQRALSTLLAPGLSNGHSLLCRGDTSDLTGPSLAICGARQENAAFSWASLVQVSVN